MYNEARKLDTEKLLDKVLSTEPDYFLPDNFADILLEKVEKRFAWKQYLREFAIYLTAIAGLLLVANAIVLFFFDTEISNMLQFFRSNALVLLGAGFLLVFVLFADRVLLRFFMYRAEMR